MTTEKILAEINANICVRRLYGSALPETPPQGSAFVDAMPWHVEGQDVDASLAAYNAAEAAKAADKQRRDEIDQSLATANIFGSTLAQLKAMTVAQFTTWFNANITDLPTARTLLRWIALIIVRKVL